MLRQGLSRQRRVPGPFKMAPSRAAPRAPPTRKGLAQAPPPAVSSPSQLAQAPPSAEECCHVSRAAAPSSAPSWWPRCMAPRAAAWPGQ